jgi:hypothetical protein
VECEYGETRETHDGEAHNEGPKASPWVALDSGPHAHLVLTVLAFKGIVHELRVSQGLGVTVVFVELVLSVDI